MSDLRTEDQKEAYRGDPDDKRLKHVERDVVIPKRVQDRVARDKCCKEYEELQECLRHCRISFRPCTKRRDVLNSCLLNWYYDPEFIQQCTEDYLYDRSEYRRTGHISDRLHDEFVHYARLKLNTAAKKRDSSKP